MPNDSELILVWGHVEGPNDNSPGLRHQYLYCRRCHMVTDMVPKGCLTPGMRPVAVMDPGASYGAVSEEEFGIFAPKIQEAMREDGIIP